MWDLPFFQGSYSSGNSGFTNLGFILKGVPFKIRITYGGTPFLFCCQVHVSSFLPSFLSFFLSFFLSVCLPACLPACLANSFLPSFFWSLSCLPNASSLSSAPWRKRLALPRCCTVSGRWSCPGALKNQKIRGSSSAQRERHATDVGHGCHGWPRSKQTPPVEFDWGSVFL